MKNFLIVLLTIFTLQLISAQKYVVKNLNSNEATPDKAVAFYDNDFVIYTTANSVLNIREKRKSKRKGLKSVGDALNNLEYHFTAIDEDGNFMNSQKLSGEINSDFGDYGLTFSEDQDVVYFTRETSIKKSKKETHFELFKADVISPSYWDNIESVSFNYVDYSIMYPSLSADGETLYFASDEGGDFNIYKIKVFGDSEYGTPEKLSSRVNSSKDETSPFIYGNTLYFSSNRLGGMGGYDVYSINLNDNTAKLKRLNSPINSSRNDYCFVMNVDGEKGFFTSNRIGGKGDDDIYFFSVDNDEEGYTSEEVSTETYEDVDSEILIVDNGESERAAIAVESARLAAIEKESAIKEAARVESARLATIEKENAIKEAARVESARLATIERENVSKAARVESARLAAIEKENTNKAARVESARLAAIEKENAVKESARVESARLATIERENASKKAARVESARLAAIEKENASKEATRLETERLAKIESAKKSSRRERREAARLAKIEEEKLQSEVLRLEKEKELASIEAARIEATKEAARISAEKETGIELTEEEDIIVVVDDVDEVIETTEKVVVKKELNEDNFNYQRRANYDITTEKNKEASKNYHSKDEYSECQMMFDKLKNIYFDFSESYIRADAANELDKVIHVMRKCPKISVVAESHTDSRASDQYNMRLSQQRSMNVVNYVLKNGRFSPNRIIGIGYGERRILNGCTGTKRCTEKQHQANRRTHFEISNY